MPTDFRPRPSKYSHSIWYGFVSDAVDPNGPRVYTYNKCGVKGHGSNVSVRYAGRISSGLQTLVHNAIYGHRFRPWMVLTCRVGSIPLSYSCGKFAPFLARLRDSFTDLLGYRMSLLRLAHFFDGFGFMFSSSETFGTTSSAWTDVVPHWIVNGIILCNEGYFGPVQFVEIKCNVDVGSLEVGPAILFDGTEEMIPGSNIGFPSASVPTLSDISFTIDKTFCYVNETIRSFSMRVHNHIYTRNHYDIIQNMIARI